MEWLLDPEVTYLNHGSFGACPSEVFDVYQRLQRELESGPTEFLGRHLSDRLAGVRATLAAFVGARPEDLALAPNATSALNAVIRSLRLQPDDQVVTTAHEYGAMLKAWQFVGARLVVYEPAELVEAVRAGPRAVFLSHVSSQTATVMPVEAVCRAAREAGVLSIVDGAHAPGQLTLDLASLGADVYAGNCHKWLYTPKGTAFLWARPEHQGWIEPVVTSWGWAPGAGFAEKHEWSGTFDPAAWLSIPAAIEAWGSFDLERCRAIAVWGHELLPPLPGRPAPQMWATELPPGDAEELARELRERHRIEAPVFEWAGRRLLRVSVAPYNGEEDVERLVRGLEIALG